ncbi:MAG: DNA gyrase inhibitor YacG [Planctomycetaceae bacterium]|nr:DNA gyrase inhibitor YacG [Planctomycetaceae bacterium]
MIQRMTCPICSKPLDDEPVARKFRPFCSDRCRKVDFHRWWDGKYAIVEELDPSQLDPDAMESESESG